MLVGTLSASFLEANPMPHKAMREENDLTNCSYTRGRLEVASFLRILHGQYEYVANLQAHL